MENKIPCEKWSSRQVYIYWHKVIFLDEKRIKKDKLMTGKYKLGQLVGFNSKVSKFQTLDSKTTDIVPYIKFKFVGKTLYGKSLTEREKSFKQFKKILEGGK